MTNTDTVAEAGQPLPPTPADDETPFYYPEERGGTLSNANVAGRRKLSQIAAEKMQQAYDRRDAAQAEIDALRPQRPKRPMLQVEPANGRSRVINIDGPDITELSEVRDTLWIRGRIRDGSLTLVEAPVRETLIEQQPQPAEQPQAEQQPQESTAPSYYDPAE